MIWRLFTFISGLFALLSLLVLAAGVWSFFGNVEWAGHLPGGIELSASGCAGKARLGVTRWRAESNEWWKYRPGQARMVVTGKTVVISDGPNTIYAARVNVDFGVHEWHGFEWRSGAMSKDPTTQTGRGVMSMPLVAYWSGSVPWYYPLPLLMILPGVWVVMRLRRQKFGPGFCAKCGYDLRGSPKRCPECGMIPKVVV